MAQIERNQEATVYIGNLDERCTDTLVWELMLQAGPVGKCSVRGLPAHALFLVDWTDGFYSLSLFSRSQCAFTKGSSNANPSGLRLL